MEQENKKQGYIVVVISIILVLILGITYAWLSISLKGKKDNSLVVGTLNLELNESDGINIIGEDVYPQTREAALAKTNNMYKFKLTNTGNINSRYTIYLEIENENGKNIIPSSNIRYLIAKEKQTEFNKDTDIDCNEFKDELIRNAKRETKDGVDYNKVILDSSSDGGLLAPNQTNKYVLRLWIDENANDIKPGMEFISKIKIVATQTNTN